MSTITSVVPWKTFRLTLPSEPNLTMTRFGTVSPAVKFRSEIPGREPFAGPGYTVRKFGPRVLPADGRVTVTLATTACGVTAPLIDGTPPCPATIRFRAPLAASVAPVQTVAVPVRVSQIRVGATAVSTAPLALGLLPSV